MLLYAPFETMISTQHLSPLDTSFGKVAKLDRKDHKKAYRDENLESAREELKDCKHYTQV